MATTSTAHRAEFLNSSDVEIVLAYNAEMRGFATYYALAYSPKAALNTLYYVWRGSLLKTLASKHKTTVAKSLAQLRCGPDLVARHQVDRKTATAKVWKLKHLKLKPVIWDTVDHTPQTLMYRTGSTEITERLHARECEYCGQTDTPCEVHHVRKLADMRGTPLHRYMKAARTRKRIVLCVSCHDDLHAGRLPDLRYQQRKEVESRVP